MTRIAVCADQSQGSSEAVEWLAQSNFLADSQVLVMTVEHSKKSEADSTSNLADTTADRFRAASPSASIDSVMHDGPVGQSLLDGSFDWQSDLIVMGKNERTGLERLLLGSVSQYVTERAHCPVMIARHPEAAGKNNILIAVDSSECSAAALEWISCQPWALKKNIVMLAVAHAMPSSYGSNATISQAAEMLLRQQSEESLLTDLLEQWSDMLAQCLGKEMVPFAVADGAPVELILKAARNWPAEMIVLGSHGRSGLSKVLLGSVSQAVAVQAPCAVLIVRGKTSVRFEQLRASIADSNELARAKKEKPHPARIHSSITGTDINGFLPYGY